MIFKRYQNLLTKCEKKSWFWHHILYFWKPEPEPGYPGFLESKPETRFFKTRPGFENTRLRTKFFWYCLREKGPFLLILAPHSYPRSLQFTEQRYWGCFGLHNTARYYRVLWEIRVTYLFLYRKKSQKKLYHTFWP